MPIPDIDTVPEEYTMFDLTMRLTRDLRAAAALITPNQQRVLVDMYYQIQENRKRGANQLRAIHEEPNEFVTMLAPYLMKLERMIVSALDIATDQSAVSRWAKAQVGIGPILAAGLAAHIDITKAKTVSAIWRFAGLDPTVTWARGTKRPWNAQLKVIQWKIGDSFVKLSNHPQCVYGHIYAERKQLEVQRNGAGTFAAQARATLETKAIRAPETLAVYQADQLPPGRLDLRARRYAVKIFLSHYFEVAYRDHYQTAPPRPYILAADPSRHTNYLPPPEPLP